MPENSGTQTYLQFVATAQTRLNVVYAGANDGFLHGFRAGGFDANRNYVANGSTPNDGREVLQPHAGIDPGAARLCPRPLVAAPSLPAPEPWCRTSTVGRRPSPPEARPPRSAKRRSSITRMRATAIISSSMPLPEPASCTLAAPGIPGWSADWASAEPRFMRSMSPIPAYSPRARPRKWSWANGTQATIKLRQHEHRLWHQSGNTFGTPQIRRLPQRQLGGHFRQWLRQHVGRCGHLRHVHRSNDRRQDLLLSQHRHGGRQWNFLYHAR